MTDDPILLSAFIVLVVCWVCMGGMAKDYIGAKGLSAYWLIVTPSGIFHYVEMTLKNNKRVGGLFWVFIAQ